MVIKNIGKELQEENKQNIMIGLFKMLLIPAEQNAKHLFGLVYT